MRVISNALKMVAAASLALTAPLTPAMAQNSRAIDRNWFVGTWSDKADCSEPVIFSSNGSYRTWLGTEARWRIERGNVIVLEGSGGRQELAFERVSDTLLRTVDGGVPSYRCDAAVPAGGTGTDGGAVTADWLIGTWSDPRDCSEPFYITRDGGFRAPNGVLGRWSLQGDVLTLVFGANRQTVTVIRVGDNELRLAESGVSSYRCG